MLKSQYSALPPVNLERASVTHTSITVRWDVSLEVEPLCSSRVTVKTYSLSRISGVFLSQRCLLYQISAVIPECRIIINTYNIFRHSNPVHSEQSCAWSKVQYICACSNAIYSVQLLLIHLWRILQCS